MARRKVTQVDGGSIRWLRTNSTSVYGRGTARYEAHGRVKQGKKQVNFFYIIAGGTRAILDRDTEMLMDVPNVGVRLYATPGKQFALIGTFGSVDGAKRYAEEWLKLYHQKKPPRVWWRKSISSRQSDFADQCWMHEDCLANSNLARACLKQTLVPSRFGKVDWNIPGKP